MTAIAVSSATRAGEAGVVLPQLPIDLAVGAIVAPSEVDATGTNAALIGCTGLDALFDGAPSDANLSIGGAWITDKATGAFAVRFIAAGGNYAGATEKILLVAKQMG